LGQGSPVSYDSLVEKVRLGSGKASSEMKDEMRGGHASRLGPTRAEIFEHLQGLATAAPLDAIAEAVGIHQNTARFHLDALTSAGLVVRQIEHREVPGRPKVLFRAARISSDASFQNLAHIMVRHFAGALEDRSERAVDAGLVWGEQVRSELVAADPGKEPLDRLVDGMAWLGYEPQLVNDPEPVLNLRPCPYAAIASDDPDVVCQLHLGLMRGILGSAQPWEVVSVEPWSGPTTCRVTLLQHSPSTVGGDERANA
jgi:predicted ArsR family transcriptional regulator